MTYVMILSCLFKSVAMIKTIWKNFNFAETPLETTTRRDDIFVVGCSFVEKEELEQWFSTFLMERNPNETFRGSRNPCALIYLSCTNQVVN